MLAVAAGIEPGKAVSLIERSTYTNYYHSLGREPEKLKRAIAAVWDEIWRAAETAARGKA